MLVFAMLAPAMLAVGLLVAESTGYEQQARSGTRHSVKVRGAERLREVPGAYFITPTPAPPHAEYVYEGAVPPLKVRGKSDGGESVCAAGGRERPGVWHQLNGRVGGCGSPGRGGRPRGGGGSRPAGRADGGAVLLGTRPEMSVRPATVGRPPGDDGRSPRRGEGRRLRHPSEGRARQGVDGPRVPKQGAGVRSSDVVVRGCGAAGRGQRRVSDAMVDRRRAEGRTGGSASDARRDGSGADTPMAGHVAEAGSGEGDAVKAGAKGGEACEAPRRTAPGRMVFGRTDEAGSEWEAEAGA